MRALDERRDLRGIGEHAVLERAAARQPVAGVAHVLARLGVDRRVVGLEVGIGREVDERRGVLVAADRVPRA